MLKYSLQLQKQQLEILKILNENYYFANKKIKSTDQIRRLYGIIGFNEYQSHKMKYPAYEFFIPTINENALKEAFENGGIFSKELKKEDLSILNFIYNKNRELRKKIYFKYPRFSITEIYNNTKIKRENIKESLERLTGILCLCQQNGTSEFYNKRREMFDLFSTTKKSWLLHPSKNNLIEGILFGIKTKGRNYRIN